MATKGQRASAFVIAFIFLLTSVGASGAIIYSILTDDDEANLSQEETQTTQPQEDSLEGTKLADFEPVGSVAKLEIIDVKEGTGETVKKGDTVTAHYTGALAKDGTIFQSSKDIGEPVTFALNQVIEGWQEGVPGMKVGGIRRLIIPAEQAYGAQSPSPNIPANSDLVFDIELFSIGEAEN